MSRAINCFIAHQQRKTIAVDKVSLPVNIPEDLRSDLENDPEALKHWLKEHGG
jgi:hypothetical protein